MESSSSVVRGADEQAMALEFLRLLHDTIPWWALAEEVLREKWSVLAKRIMASSGEDLLEFMNNVVRDVAGDQFVVGRGKELEDFVNKLDKNKQKGLIDYIKARAIPLIIILSARVQESRKQEGSKGEEVKKGE